MAALTRKATLNDGSNSVVTVTLPGKALDAAQTNSVVMTYKTTDSIEATVDLDNYTPVPGSE